MKPKERLMFEKIRDILEEIPSKIDRDRESINALEKALISFLIDIRSITNGLEYNDKRKIIVFEAILQCIEILDQNQFNPEDN
jgi:hypothetical protein